MQRRWGLPDQPRGQHGCDTHTWDPVCKSFVSESIRISSSSMPGLRLFNSLLSRACPSVLMPRGIRPSALELPRVQALLPQAGTTTQTQFPMQMAEESEL